MSRVVEIKERGEKRVVGCHIAAARSETRPADCAAPQRPTAGLCSTARVPAFRLGRGYSIVWSSRAHRTMAIMWLKARDMSVQNPSISCSRAVEPPDPMAVAASSSRRRSRTDRWRTISVLDGPEIVACGSVGF